MNKSIFSYYSSAVGFIYEKIIREKMSDDVENFLKNVSYVGLGTFIAAVFSFTFNILSGRLLGPVGYGKFGLVQSIGSFLYIPMIMGYSSAIVKYSAEKDDLDRQKKIISTTYTLVLFFTIVSLFIYLLIPQKILEYFSVSNEMFHLSIVFAILFVLYTLTNSTLRGLHEMKKYAIFTSTYSFILLLVFLFFAFFKMISWQSMIFSLFFAYAATSGIILFFIRKYFVFKFDKSWARRLTNYSLYTIIGGITFVFYSNIDQIVINMYMSAKDLGIYKAYYSSSINIAYVLFGIFMSVFFPVASKCEDKKSIFKKINKLIPYLIICGIPFIIFFEFLILNLYGSTYKINILLIISFAIVSVLIVYFGLYDWTLCSEGIEGVKLVNKSTILIAIINITLDIYLIPRLGLFGATISTITAFIIGIYFLLKKGKIYELWQN
ncbi:MAG: oligosaccharide flippase family protein [Methanobacterium sp.]